MFVDVLPNVMAPVIVYTTLLMPVVIVVQATLSFLGLGLEPPTADWGGMISTAQRYYRTAWWFIAFPGWRAPDHHPGVQPVRRRRARRLRPARRPADREVSARMVRFLIVRTLTRAPGPLADQRWRCSRCSSSCRATSRAPWAGARPRRRPSPRSTQRLGLDQPLWKQYARASSATRCTATSATTTTTRCPVTHDHRRGTPHHALAGGRRRGDLAGARASPTV